MQRLCRHCRSTQAIHLPMFTCGSCTHRSLSPLTAKWTEVMHIFYCLAVFYSETTLHTICEFEELFSQNKVCLHTLIQTSIGTDSCSNGLHLQTLKEIHTQYTKLKRILHTIRESCKAMVRVHARTYVCIRQLAIIHGGGC